MATKRTTKKTNDAPIGCLLGLFIIILLSGLILFNKDRIEQTLKNTRVRDLFNPKPPVQDIKTEPVQPPAQIKEPSPENQKPQSEIENNSTPTKITQDTQKTQDTQPVQKPSTPSSSQPQSTSQNGPKTIVPTATKPEKVPQQPQTVERSLYFMKLAEDGSLVRTKVTRTIKVSESPLLDVIQNLLSGPTDLEKKRGLISVIPPGSKILSATVKDGVAYLNFNDAFQFNSYGMEGYTAQLKQLVWTATEFSTVQAVQILIENKNSVYLGGEGVRIDKPLTRESF
ncbi:GerMN domain-containing protein [Gracilinema caldarium]|uniref:GerMN domain-containing protein n=1 Tax=Gracilinema caldarium TaxID=215591 RepID=UPI0026F099D1|nr:GerMN domain-containing protein [Gracilinema caldarium]